MAYYIGIDIGTSSAKLTMIDEAGEVVKESSREYRISEPRPGWREIDPEVWMDAVEEAMEELLEAKDSGAVRGIGVTGQMHTVVFLDADGHSIRPALMWNDTRTNDRLADIRRMAAEHPRLDCISRIISTGSPAMNLLWLKENEPRNFERLRKFLIGPDYIVYRLTGCCQTDYCEASTSSLFDLYERKWSEEMRCLLDLPEYIYPPVKGAAETAGNVMDIWKEKFRFSGQVKVLVGTGDNPAAAISTGCFVKKYPVLSLGTSGVLMYAREEPDFGVKGKNILFSLYGKEQMILVQGSVQSCGSSISWWMNQVLETTDFQKEIQDAPEYPKESSILFYPHLAGDKTLYADAELRGAFLGLGTNIGRSELTIAVLEGICLAVKQLAEAMGLSGERLRNLKVIGGGAKNPVWMQILADVLNVSICQAEGGSSAGYGIAVAAASAVGNASMEQALEQTVRIKKVFEPRRNRAKLYEKKYETYRKVYDAMKMLD